MALSCIGSLMFCDATINLDSLNNYKSNLIFLLFLISKESSASETTLKKCNIIVRNISQFNADNYVIQLKKYIYANTIRYLWLDILNEKRNEHAAIDMFDLLAFWDIAVFENLWRTLRKSIALTSNKTELYCTVICELRPCAVLFSFRTR